MPTQLIPLDEFPHTAYVHSNTYLRLLLIWELSRNGKTDRRVLEKLARERMLISTPQITGTVDSQKTLAVTKIETPAPVYQQETKEKDSSASLATTIHRSADSTKASSITDVGSDLSSIEKREYPWSGYEDDEIPEKTQGKWTRNLRHQVFSLYRRLFGVVFLTNLGVFISILIKGANAQQIGTIVIANLFCAILMRQDYVINALFTVCCSVPSS